MVVSRFEADYLRAGAGLFESFPGQLSRRGVAARVADAMRRGAPVSGSWDFLVLDCFELASLTVEEAAARVGLTPKGERGPRRGSVGLWEPGGQRVAVAGRGAAGS